ncbi:glutamate reuptake [Sparganum proliferum]
MFVTKFLSPFYFGRTSEVYRRLQPKEKGEWDSRCVSSLHAASVSVLSFISLVIDHDLWINPITTVSRVGCIALAISIGYMIADTINMLAFQSGMELFLFSFHHLLVAICFCFLLSYRVGVLFGVMRLTSEISTPFLNQRWFCKTVGGDGAEYRVAVITLFFSSTFFVGRYVLCFLYWYIFVGNYNTPPHLQIAPELPRSLGFFISLPALLDCLNIAWGFPVFAITKKALQTLHFLPAQKKEKVDGEQQQNPSIVDSESRNGTACHDHCNGNLKGTVPHTCANGHPTI